MYSRPGKSDTAGYLKALQVFTGGGELATLRVNNKSASTIYIQLFDSASAAAEGATPSAAPVPVPPGYYESDTPLNCLAGLYICASSTAAPKTLIGSNDAWITAEYRY